MKSSGFIKVIQMVWLGGVIFGVTSCAYLPQRRVLVSSHPGKANASVTLASFPAELRAYAILHEVDSEAHPRLWDLAAQIRQCEARGDRVMEGQLTREFNRLLHISTRNIIVPEAPARVVVSQAKLDPTLKYTPGGSNTLDTGIVMQQAVTNLAMSDNELKAYLAYLAFIDSQNRGPNSTVFSNLLNTLVTNTNRTAD